MCGIVGIWGRGDAVEVVVNGLSRLEYRGYDSAGVVTPSTLGPLVVRKAVGKLAALREVMAANPLPAHHPLAMGHTRWATHGAPSTLNAHPHVATLGNVSVAVVHNGIIENYAELRAGLTARGAKLVSETDTEALPFLIAEEVVAGKTLGEAVRHVAALCRGNFAFVALRMGSDELAGHKRGAPLCVALGDTWRGLVSDPLAVAGLTEKFAYLTDGCTVVVDADGWRVVDVAGAPVAVPVQVVDLRDEAAGKQGYRHFMLKEMHEQPDVVRRILAAYTTVEGVVNLPMSMAMPMTMSQLNVVACGTAYYAALVGKYVLEQLVRVPVNVDVASEFRYRNPPYVPGGVFLAVSQSGETADTLAALEHAKAAGQTIWVMTNVPTSSMARAADVVIPLLAGREIAVASTKAFTAMVTVLTLLALQLRGDAKAEVATLRTLPSLLETALGQAAAVEPIARKLADGAAHMLYLGRGVLAPLALEGALKMKEISYIHAEGYASGEMKHGPIALVDQHMPVLTLASGNDPLWEKTMSNLQEVAARGGQLLLVTDAAGVAHLGDKAAGMQVLALPDAPLLLAPMVFAIPLQYLAYLTAVAKGTDVDQPRNLAKSVTVE